MRSMHRGNETLLIISCTCYIWMVKTYTCWVCCTLYAGTYTIAHIRLHTMETVCPYFKSSKVPRPKQTAICSVLYDGFMWFQSLPLSHSPSPPTSPLGLYFLLCTHLLLTPADTSGQLQNRSGSLLQRWEKEIEADTGNLIAGAIQKTVLHE